ncbi:hypothetical protein [Phormidesmis sp. 146-33]
MSGLFSKIVGSVFKDRDKERRERQQQEAREILEAVERVERESDEKRKKEQIESLKKAGLLEDAQRYWKAQEDSEKKMAEYMQKIYRRGKP